jgi:hypothetical protein
MEMMLWSSNRSTRKCRSAMNHGIQEKSHYFEALVKVRWSRRHAVLVHEDTTAPIDEKHGNQDTI